MSYKKTVVKNFAIFTGKRLRWSLLLNKVATLIKRRPQHKRFYVNTAEVSRTPVLKNICERLLLNVKFHSFRTIS